MARSTRPDVYHGCMALGLTLGLTVLLFLVFRLSWTWWHLLLAWLVGINIVAFGYYGFDKGRAGTGARRVPEVVLHGLAVFGGTIGAYLGMRVFRHKTVKSSFRVLFWVLVVFQVLIVAALIYRLTMG